MSWRRHALPRPTFDSPNSFASASTDSAHTRSYSSFRVTVMLISTPAVKSPSSKYQMCSAPNLQATIAAFHDRAVASPHHRYLSWEHCYRFFRSRTRDALLKDKDAAALQLAFYLASWGM